MNDEGGVSLPDSIAQKIAERVKAKVAEYPPGRERCIGTPVSPDHETWLTAAGFNLSEKSGPHSPDVHYTYTYEPGFGIRGRLLEDVPAGSEVTMSISGTGIYVGSDNCIQFGSMNADEVCENRKSLWSMIHGDRKLSTKGRNTMYVYLVVAVNRETLEIRDAYVAAKDREQAIFKFGRTQDEVDDLDQWAVDLVEVMSFEKAED